jgi:hypothetical protein
MRLPMIRLKEQAVEIAEAPARESAQRRSAAQGRHHEIRHGLAVGAGGELRARVQGHDPGLFQDRDVLDGLVVGTVKTELAVGVVKVVEADAEVRSLPRVAG